VPDIDSDGVALVVVLPDVDGEDEEDCDVFADFVGDVGDVGSHAVPFHISPIAQDTRRRASSSRKLSGVSIAPARAAAATRSTAAARRAPPAPTPRGPAATSAASTALTPAPPPAPPPLPPKKRPVQESPQPARGRARNVPPENAEAAADTAGLASGGIGAHDARAADAKMNRSAAAPRIAGVAAAVPDTPSRSGENV